MDGNNGKYDEADRIQARAEVDELRTADINFVLDTILAHAKDTGSDAVYQLIDTEKIGLIGHSLGGEASAQVGQRA